MSIQAKGIWVAWLVAAAGLLPGINSPARAEDFPKELVDFVPYGHNPVFTGAGPGHWDEKIRERGWILNDAAGYHLWYTGYTGSEPMRLGYATSKDGIAWQRHPDNPILPDLWIEDMMVVPRDGQYAMFAEGRDDRAQLLLSRDRLHWEPRGMLDIRRTNGESIGPGPFGTPTAWFEAGSWYLMYERRDLGVWLATSADLKVWRLVQDEPVLLPGPDSADLRLIAVNQVIRHGGRYYAFYHGRGDGPNWSTNVAGSDDLVHWRKCACNPLFPVALNKSSGILVPVANGWRFYTMHAKVEMHLHRSSDARRPLQKN